MHFLIYKPGSRTKHLQGQESRTDWGHCSDEKCTLMKYIGPEAPMVPLTNTQLHTVNMFDLLKGKHNSVGFFDRVTRSAVCARRVRS